MMRSCILSLSRITQQTSGHEIVMRGLGTTVSKIVDDVLTYAYYADGHHGTRRSRTGLLKTLANMRISSSPTPLPPGMGLSPPIPWSPPRARSPTEMLLLEKAVLDCLYDCVEDTLSLMDRNTRSHTAGALLNTSAIPHTLRSQEYHLLGPK